VASNPGQVPAGGRAKISIVVYTRNRGGSSLRKRFIVTTNDPGQPKVTLTVVGEVKGFLEISPRYIRLIGVKGKDLRQTLKIVPDKGYPFKITGIDIGQTRDFDYKMVPLGKNPHIEGYQLVVWNKRTEKGAYHGNITIKTDLKEKQVLRIPVSGRIMETRTKPNGKPKQRESQGD
jgi:hypothetical protein